MEALTKNLHLFIPHLFGFDETLTERVNLQTNILIKPVDIPLQWCQKWDPSKLTEFNFLYHAIDQQVYISSLPFFSIQINSVDTSNESNEVFFSNEVMSLIQP